MTNTKQFIEDGIAGGWGGSFLTTKRVTLKNGRVTLKYEECEGGGWTSKHKENIPLSEALLDPKFWQAVGKTRGQPNTHKYTMMYFMSLLADGLTIEDSLTKLR